MSQDAIGNFYDCRLTLQPAVVSYLPWGAQGSACKVPLRVSLTPQDPVCTPDGYLYSREAILESLLQQKKSNKRKYAAWEAQQQDELRKVFITSPKVPIKRFAGCKSPAQHRAAQHCCNPSCICMHKWCQGVSDSGCRIRSMRWNVL